MSKIATPYGVSIPSLFGPTVALEALTLELLVDGCCSWAFLVRV